MSILLRTPEIRHIEALAIAGLPPGTLMSRAADAVADACSALARTLAGARMIVAWIGPGNNGGDALLAALRLREHGYRVRAIALDAHRVPTGDAGAVWQQAEHEHLPVETGAAWDDVFAATAAPLVIDGLFGIGLQRPLDENCARICTRIEELGCPVVAVDVPSGIDADTGRRIGGYALRARHTVTMIADKPGLHTGAALDYVGRVSVATLGIEPALLETPGGDVRGTRFDLAEARKNALPARHPDSNKGSFGSVLCYGGAPGMRGAVLLAARGAQTGGAGRIYVATPSGELFDPAQAQWMSAASDTRFDGFDAVAIGCGLGTSGAAKTALQRALEQARALVLDADALNLLASDAQLRRACAGRHTRAEPQSDCSPASPAREGTVLTGARCIATPHPLEAARLLGTDAATVQSDRIAAACALAARLQCVILLKGAGSVVATPDGNWSVIDAGSPALASAGTGDVLAGLCASLLARGLDARRAACLAAWLHGTAGSLWAAGHGTEDGLPAACLDRWIRAAMAQLHPAADAPASGIRQDWPHDHAQEKRG